MYPKVRQIRILKWQIFLVVFVLEMNLKGNTQILFSCKTFENWTIKKYGRFCPDLNLQNGTHLPGFKMVRLPDFGSHSQNQKLTSTEGVL